jgi:hypothetical protein
VRQVYNREVAEFFADRLREPELPEKFAEICRRELDSLDVQAWWLEGAILELTRRLE